MMIVALIIGTMSLNMDVPEPRQASHVEVYLSCVAAKSAELEPSNEAVDTIADAALTLCESYLANAVRHRVKTFRDENPDSRLSDYQIQQIAVSVLTRSARDYAISDVVQMRANARTSRKQ